MSEENSTSSRGWFQKSDREKNSKVKLYALIVKGNNQQPDVVDITKQSEEFTHNDRTYFIVFDNVMAFKISSPIPFVKTKHYLFYYYDNPAPLHINEMNVSSKHDVWEYDSAGYVKTRALNSAFVTTIMKTNMLRRVEAGSRTSLFDKLDAKTVIIILCAIGVVIYLLQGGQIA